MGNLREGNHPLRKALNCSLVEFAVLCDIHQMSQLEKFNYWCIKSREKTADWLGISEDTVLRAIKTLEMKGLILRNKDGHTKLTEYAKSIDASQDYAFVMKLENDVLASSNIQDMLQDGSQNAGDGSQNAGDGSQIAGQGVAKCGEGGSKMRVEGSQNAGQVYTYSNNNKNNIKSLEQKSVFCTEDDLVELLSDRVALPNLKDYFYEEDVLDALKLWLEHKRDVKSGYKRIGLKMLIKKLNKFEKEQVLGSIENSISNNYSGLFPESIKVEKKEEPYRSKSQFRDLEW